MSNFGVDFETDKVWSNSSGSMKPFMLLSTSLNLLTIDELIRRGCSSFRFDPEYEFPLDDGICLLRKLRDSSKLIRPSASTSISEKRLNACFFKNKFEDELALYFDFKEVTRPEKIYNICTE